MHHSLIIQEYKSPNLKNEIIYWHGKEFFNIGLVYPEVSGYYEILIDPYSDYKRLVEQKIFIPILYYESKDNTWSYMNKIISFDNIKVIGWRLSE